MAEKIDLSHLPLAELFLYHLKDLSEQQLAVLQKMGFNISVGAGYGFPANTKNIQTVRVPILMAGKAVQGPEMPVPDGFQLMIKSHPANPAASFIYVAESQSLALDANGQWPLIPNEFVTYGVQNASSIWVSGFVAPFPAGGLFVVFTCEKR